MFGWKLMTLPYVLCLIVLPILLIFFREPLGKLVAREPDWKPENGENSSSRTSLSCSR